MISPASPVSRPVSAPPSRRSLSRWFRIVPGFVLLALAAFPSARAQNPANFNSVAVEASATQTINVSASSGTVASVAVLTMGAPKLDYTAATGGADTCTGTTFTAPGSCSFSVTFSPLYPGPRNGAVVLQDASGNTLGTEYLTGIGQGSLAVMIPGAISIAAGQVDQWNPPNDGKSATQADLDLPSGIALDGAGDVFIADSNHNRVREIVAATGVINTVAGDGSTGYDPSVTTATAASLTLPGGIAIDGAGNLYIADTGNNVIREVNLSTGIIATVAGTGSTGYNGDNGAATSAELSSPEGITVDGAGNLYIADTGNNVIRKVAASTGVITTIAGSGANPRTCTGSTDALGDGCAATSAVLNAPYAVAFDPGGNMYIPDSGDNLIRKVAASDTISSYAGDGASGYSGDGSAATSAELYSPLGVACDAAGNLYIADARNYVVRKISSATGVISTVAGNNTNNVYNDGKSGYVYGNGQGGDAYTGGGIAWAGPSPKVTGAGIYAPWAVAVAPTGDLYIAEYYDHVIRKVTANAATLFFTPALWVGQVSAPQDQTVENDGNQSLSFSAVASDANSTVGSAGTCSTTSAVAVDDQCTIQAEFSPTTSNNPLVANLTLTAAQANSPLTLAAVGQALAQNAPVVSITSSPNPSNYAEAVGFTVTVAKSPSSTQGTPTGTVTLYDLFPAPASPPTVPNAPAAPPGVVIGTATLGASGTATIQDSSLAVGIHDIYAAYSGDTYYVAANSATPLAQQVTEQVSVTLTNSSGNNPSTWNTPVTFTADVNITGNVSTSGTSVSFYNGATYLGSAPLNASNTATFTTSALPPGNNGVTAAYTDVNGVSAPAAGYTQTVKQTTTTGVTSSATGNQSIYGTPVTFTATVTATGTVVPTGTVVFSDGAATLATVVLNPGTGATAVATYTTATLGAGSHSITAAYGGDIDDFSSNSLSTALTVNPATTRTALAASANPAIAGSSVAFSATVTSSGGNVPTGTVNFYNGSDLLGSSTVNASGAAVFTARLPVGSYSLTASYQGDSNDGSSASAPALNFSVIQATTAVQLQSSATAVTILSPVTFTATVSGNGGTPTGSVTFMDGTTPLGTANLNAGGVATFTTSALPFGQQSITAQYSGDTDDAGSVSSAVSVTVSDFSTQTTLAASTTTTLSNQPVVLLATVVSASGKAITGTVTFLSGATTLGTATVGSNGSASLSTTLTPGADTVTAQYSGDTEDAASTSGAVTITVGPATDFSIQLSPTSVSIPTGDYANVNISLASLYGFADNVALGCSSLPASVTCNFATTNTSLAANGTASVVLTIDTNSPLVSGSDARNHLPATPGSNPGVILAAFLFPGAGLLTFWRFRRRGGALKLVAILAVLTGATLAMNGCGGLGLSNAQPGTYVIQVTATGTKTNITHVANLTVQVTQ